jgi:uncharacterized protein (TIGR03067 family)
VTQLSLTLALVLAAPALKPGPKPVAAHPLVGKWTVESYTRAGKPMMVGPATVEMTADRWIYRGTSEADSYLRVDPATAAVDVWLPSSDNTPPPTALGVYKLDGDTLTIHSTLDRVRPAEVTDSPTGNVYVMVLKRRKD